MKTRITGVLISAWLSTCLLPAQDILFDFENAPLHTSLPLSLTVGGLTADFSATGQGFSIQLPSQSVGVTPAGFSGYCISPNSVYAADLLVRFSQVLNNFSILYAPQELACDSSATMRVTAYLGLTYVGTSTMTADPPGTWPSAILSFASTQPFDNVVVHYDSPPPTQGDYGPIFVADNMLATVVPEPSGLPLLALGLGLFFVHGRKGNARSGLRCEESIKTYSRIADRHGSARTFAQHFERA